MNLVHGPYLSDLLAQPDALRAAGASLSDGAAWARLRAALRDGRFARVVLTGMGSSWHALYPLHLRLSAAGVVSHWIEAAELVLGFAPLKARETLLIVVSQSGESAEVVALLRGGGFGHIVAVTNQPASTLGRAAGTTLPLHAGAETTVSCKTYVATLAVLHGLGAALLGGDVAGAAEEVARVEAPMRAYLGRYREHVAVIGKIAAGIRATFVTGRGVSLATAGTGGLILKEATRQPAEGMSGAAFRHGPFELLSERILVLVLVGAPPAAALNRRLAADAAAHGGRVALVAAGDDIAEAFRLPATPEALLPLAEILPVQMLSLALAARDGREAGRFERATKITTVE